MNRRLITLAVAAALLVAACGDDESVISTTTLATTTTAVAPTTSEATTTTVASTTGTPTAFTAMADYFTAVEDLDRAIGAAAALFNASWEGTGVVDAAATTAIEQLGTDHLRDLIPPGLQPDLEVAALAVFADLDSRVSALQGAVRFETMPDDLLFCLGLGGTSHDRFQADYDRLRNLAAAAPAPTAAPDSVEAGVLAVRLEAIHSMNFGCDSCGGVAYDEPIPVNWEAHTVVDGVEFEATFDGTRWQIMIYAC